MARIATWAFILSSTVRFRSLPAALRLLSVKRTTPSTGSFDAGQVATAVDAVLGIDRFIFKPVCWKRATLIHHFLGLRGCETTIVFGIRKDTSGELRGHAWLEKGGTPILEHSIPDYTVTYRFPSADSCKVELATMLSE